MPRNGKAADERAPLLVPEPTTADASNERLVDEEAGEREVKPRISVFKGVLCLLGLACLIFLQGTQLHISWLRSASLEE